MDNIRDLLENNKKIIFLIIAIVIIICIIYANYGTLVEKFYPEEKEQEPEPEQNNSPLIRMVSSSSVFDKKIIIEPNTVPKLPNDIKELYINHKWKFADNFLLHTSENYFIPEGYFKINDLSKISWNIYKGAEPITVYYKS